MRMQPAGDPTAGASARAGTRACPVNDERGGGEREPTPDADRPDTERTVDTISDGERTLETPGATETPKATVTT